jgi:alkylation response protein AidB-like acyl-CoA dehydrogenase
MTAERDFEESLRKLAALANSADAAIDWPADSWRALLQSGALRWCVPSEHGGEGLEGGALLDRYERLAGACLTTCFILSQRDSACRRLIDSQNDRLCRLLLPTLANGGTCATVGLSQLTTSRQHLGPSLRAELREDCILLDGDIPWVTGAARADYIIIGAVLPDHTQILVVLPQGSSGVVVEPPLPLMALQGSMTAQIHCRDARIDRRWLLAGPAERVMAGGRGGTGGLETSCLALGLAGAAIDHLHGEAKARRDLQPITDRLEQSRSAVRGETHSLAKRGFTPEQAAQLRASANSLVLRATQAALTASKGTGFLRDHPAQRWARQALFFLVWSCPRPAAEATLDALIPHEDCVLTMLDELRPPGCSESPSSS